jgi:peptidoglycan glycosyltransferase
VYLTHFTLFRAEDVKKSSFNKRLWADENATLRGKIYDVNGVLLAESTREDNGYQTRRYYYGSLYAHVIGYNSTIYGKSQIESTFNDLLLGKDILQSTFNINSVAEKGHDLTLTLDNSVQQAAAKAMGTKHGAVVALDPKTGDVIACYSYPTFDPNDEVLTNTWTTLVNDEDSPILSRATNGLYAPGSTFKTITAAAVLKEDLERMTFNDTGSVVIDGRRFKNYQNKAMGNLDLTKSYALSSNVAFCQWGLQVGADALRQMAYNFGFEKNLESDINITTSRFPQKDMSKTDLASAAIGQWQVLSTPIEMAMVAASVVNRGQMVTPTFVKRATNAAGNIVYDAKKKSTMTATDYTKSLTIEKMMTETVKTGTATACAIDGAIVGGKTGTAENEKQGKEHAWFIGFAMDENRDSDKSIAVAVIVEYSGGTGGTLAIPVARSVMKTYLGK